MRSWGGFCGLLLGLGAVLARSGLDGYDLVKTVGFDLALALFGSIRKPCYNEDFRMPPGAYQEHISH